MEEDRIRSEIIERHGFTIVRFTNEQVLYDTATTINNIKQTLNHINMSIQQNTCGSPLPIKGEMSEGQRGSTLFDKIWDAHVVQQIEDGPTQLYIDRLYAHEVTSPQAFDTLRDKGIGVFRPDHVVAMPDHNTPSDQQERIDDPIGRKQVETLKRNCEEFGIRHFAMGTKDNGIIHVVGPEKALSLPGMTIVCGDSHTSTHGAVGALAMGIGTSEVAQVLASETILQSKPKSMRINIEGELKPGVTAMDVALYINESKHLFHMLLQNEESIEEETGFQFDWRELPERKASRIVLTKPVDFGDKSQWGAQFTWIEDVMLKMKKAFKKYL